MTRPNGAPSSRPTGSPMAQSQPPFRGSRPQARPTTAPAGTRAHRSASTSQPTNRRMASGADGTFNALPGETFRRNAAPGRSS